MGELDNVFHDFKEIQETWKEKKKISLTKKSVFQSGGSYASEELKLFWPNFFFWFEKIIFHSSFRIVW